MTETIPTEPPPPTLPEAPRRITRRASRRAWGEAPVRFWWKCAIVVAVVTIYISVYHIHNALRERKLRHEGVPIVATIVEVNGTPRANFAVLRDDNVRVKVSGVLPDGRKLENVPLVLPPAESYAKVGEPLKLVVDPADPEHRWAEASEEILPWWRVLAVTLFLLLPVILILLALAEWRRRQMLAVWRDGREVDAVVVSSKHSATAPMSRMLYFTIVNGFDKRIFKTLYPTRAGLPRPGDVLHMVALHDRPQRAIVAELYNGGGG
jgi:hypothetical protein